MSADVTYCLSRLVMVLVPPVPVAEKLTRLPA
jgi:hypothetical protein